MMIKNFNCQLISNGKFNFINKIIRKIPKDHCLIKMKYCGICSSDIYRGFDNMAYHYPLTMGHELSGEIVSIGKKIKNFKVGDRVVVFPLIPCKKCEQCKKKSFNMCKSYSYYGSRQNGGFSEYILSKEWNLLKIPKKIKSEDAACIEPMSIGTHSINKVKFALNKNKKILIIGAGFIGMIILEILKKIYKEKKLYILDRNNFKLNIASKHTKNIINVSKKNKNKISELNDQFDLIFEASGNNNNFVNSINFSKPGGAVVWLGNINKNLEIEKNIVSKILRKELKIFGSWNADFDSSKKIEGSKNDWIDSFGYISKGVKPSKYISHFISLLEIPTFIEKLYFHKKRLLTFQSLKVMVKNL